jgi:hypothetical protein
MYFFLIQKFSLFLLRLLNFDNCDRSKTVLIEVHGDSHFITENEMRGSSILKYRLLIRDGWHILILTKQKCF